MEVLGIVMVIVGVVMLLAWVMSLVRAVRSAEIRAEMANETARDYAHKWQLAVEREQAEANKVRELTAEIRSMQQLAQQLTTRIEQLERQVAA
jgi:hypothetical protein